MANFGRLHTWRSLASKPSEAPCRPMHFLTRTAPAFSCREHIRQDTALISRNASSASESPAFTGRDFRATCARQVFVARMDLYRIQPSIGVYASHRRSWPFFGLSRRSTASEKPSPGGECTRDRVEKSRHSRDNIPFLRYDSHVASICVILRSRAQYRAVATMF